MVDITGANKDFYLVKRPFEADYYVVSRDMHKAMRIIHYQDNYDVKLGDLVIFDGIVYKVSTGILYRIVLEVV